MTIIKNGYEHIITKEHDCIDNPQKVMFRLNYEEINILLSLFKGFDLNDLCIEFTLEED